MKKTWDTFSTSKVLIKKLKRAGLSCRRIHVSPQGSVYIIVYGSKRRHDQKIRIANHHANSRKLPKYNVLIGYGLQEKVITNSKKFYYSGYMLDLLVGDLLYKLYPKKKEENKCQQKDYT